MALIGVSISALAAAGSPAAAAAVGSSGPSSSAQILSNIASGATTGPQPLNTSGALGTQVNLVV
jgi:hypothetical protein